MQSIFRPVSSQVHQRLNRLCTQVVTSKFTNLSVRTMASEPVAKTIFRKEYQPPAFLAPTVDLQIDLHCNDAEESLVKSTVLYVKNKDGPGGDLALHGETKPAQMRLVDIFINGQKFDDYLLEDTSLVIPAKALQEEAKVEETKPKKQRKSMKFRSKPSKSIQFR